MSQHNLTFTVPERPVGNADIIFTVYRDEEKFGELRISRGAAVWFPANKVKGYRLSWDQVDRVAREIGRYGAKRGP